jgi:hypothetical protein
MMSSSAPTFDFLSAGAVTHDLQHLRRDQGHHE